MQTKEIGRQIPLLVKELGIKKFLDVPCGDFNWFSKMNLELDQYIGGDIIEEIVDNNSNIYGRQDRTFIKIDLIKDKLPDADILLCRDCLVHLSNEDIFNVIQNVKYYFISIKRHLDTIQCMEAAWAMALGKN